MAEKTYRGWKNYETWNVRKWLQNDDTLYLTCLNFSNYHSLVAVLKTHYEIEQTPDGVRFDNPSICSKELDALLVELT